MDKNISYQRYHRQIILKDFGEAAQEKLRNAKVLVIGAGGLGCPVLQYLSAAGVGTIGIVDDDRVSISNLHRQVLYSTNDIGLPKVDRAVEKLRQVNPEIQFYLYPVRLTSKNAADIMQPYHIILDGSDNFPTRYLVNDASVLLNKKLVYGAVSQYQGQVSVFNCSSDENKTPVNYRDLFPEPPLENEIHNCEEAGVLGVLPGIIGTMMANEAIKLITGLGTPLHNRLLTYDALTNKVYDIELTAKENSRFNIPPTLDALKAMEYEFRCSTPSEFEIDNEFFNELIDARDVDIIDVREKGETPIVTEFDHHNIPLARLKDSVANLKSGTIVLICQTGKRSVQAAEQLNKIFADSKKIYSLRGGVNSWNRNVQKKQNA